MITINHSLNKLEQQQQLADLLQQRVGLLSNSEKLWEFIKKIDFITFILVKQLNYLQVSITFLKYQKRSFAA